mmetsp:Transcript_6996/g.13884  ORF Transcript_6996/g.13884 Transcript_6996/m.13884 type:complete len:450 (-) Transcript_6996:1659-3008(-)
MLLPCRAMAAMMARGPPSSTTLCRLLPLDARMRKAPHPAPCTPACARCACIAWTTAATPPASATLTRLSLFTAARFQSVSHALFWMPVCEMWVRMAETTAGMPPAAAILLWLSSLTANCRSAPSPCSCTTIEVGCSLSARTMHSMPPSIPTLLLLAAFNASPQSARHPHSCTVAFFACCTIPATIAPIPPASTMRAWFASKWHRHASTLHVTSWISELALCMTEALINTCATPACSSATSMSILSSESRSAPAEFAACSSGYNTSSTPHPSSCTEASAAPCRIRAMTAGRSCLLLAVSNPDTTVLFLMYCRSRVASMPLRPCRSCRASTAASSRSKRSSGASTPNDSSESRAPGILCCSRIRTSAGDTDTFGCACACAPAAPAPAPTPALAINGDSAAGDSAADSKPFSGASSDNIKSRVFGIAEAGSAAATTGTSVCASKVSLGLTSW